MTVLRDMKIPDEYIFVDKASGENFNRPEYQLLKRVMREGDFVKSITRFRRNKQEILKELAMVSRCEYSCCGDRHSDSGHA